MAWNGSRSLASAACRRWGSRRTRPGRRCSRGARASPRSRSSTRATCRSASPARSRGSIPSRSPEPRRRVAWTATSCSSLAAAQAAADDASLVVDDPTRAGVLFGTAIGGFHTMMEQHDILRDRGWERVAPWFLPQCLPDVASGAIATRLDLRGHNLAPISACSTGAHAVMEAAELIRRGDADVVLAGGGEALHPPADHRGVHDDEGPWRSAARRGPGDGLAAVRRHARRLRVRRGRDRARDGVGGARGAPRRAHPCGGRRGRQHQRRLPRSDAAPRLAGRRDDDAARAREGRHRPLGDRLHQSPRHVDAAGRRRRDTGDQAGLRRPRAAPVRLVDEVGHRPPVRRSRARSRSRSARSRYATRSSRRRSTTAIPTPSATSTTCPRARARSSSSTPSRTRWASAATTAASCCAAITPDLRRGSGPRRARRTSSS